MKRRHVIPTRPTRRALLLWVLTGFVRPAVAYPLVIALCGLAALFLASQGAPL